MQNKNKSTVEAFFSQPRAPLKPPANIVPIPTQNQNSYAKPTPGKCFKCNQVGHKSNDCPLKKMANVAKEIEEKEEEEEPESSAEFEDEQIMVAEDEGEYINCVVQRVLLSPKQAEYSQRHQIFRTRCTIQVKVCDVIIDGGCCENIISKSLVKVLELKTEKHDRPYKIGWIKKGPELTVAETCKSLSLLVNTTKTQSPVT